jgi:membrane-bound serine protease (ClpP class)
MKKFGLVLLLVCYETVLAGNPSESNLVSSSVTNSLRRYPEHGVVYVIPIHDMIERALVYFIHRRLEDAQNKGAVAIIFEMKTPGGRLDATEEIVRMLLELNVPTYAFVNDRAISAGAIIALATDKIYMSPGALIGDAMPIIVSPFGGAQPLPDELREKMMSPTVALIRMVAQRKGHDPELAEAMVRPEKEYKIGEKLISAKGNLLTLTSDDAQQIVGEGSAARRLLSAGTVQNIHELLKREGLDKCEVVTMSISPAEKIARIIDGFPVSGILLALGLLAIYIEIKTPGFGLPGITGIALLLLWFWGHHIAGLAGAEEALLFALGIILILLEIFVIPGFGITGITGIALLVLGVIMSMVEHYPGRPVYEIDSQDIVSAIWKFGIAVIVLFAGGWLIGKIMPKTILFQQVSLGTTLDKATITSDSISSSVKVGMRGVAVTPLRPSGIGVFDNRRVDVIARGDFIKQGAQIVIAEIQGNRIVVDSCDVLQQQKSTN